MRHHLFNRGNHIQLCHVTEDRHLHFCAGFAPCLGAVEIAVCSRKNRDINDRLFAVKRFVRRNSRLCNRFGLNAFRHEVFMLRSCSSSVHFVEGRSTSLIEFFTADLLAVDNQAVAIRHLA